MKGRLTVENYRGRRVPRVLGIGLAAVGVLGTLSSAWAGFDIDRRQWGAAAGSLLMFGAGLVDDLHPMGPRGLRNHFRELAAGRMTTGILKVLVAVASAVVVVALLGRGSAPIRVAAVVLVASSPNVWNGLDVRPGRALKAFLLVVTVPALLGSTPLGFVLSLCVAAVVALVADLREWGMLGDSGSNLLGFAVGVQLAAALPEWSMWPAAALAVALNVVADTVTFSRVIEAVPPLRWFDRLGRIPEQV